MRASRARRGTRVRDAAVRRACAECAARRRSVGRPSSDAREWRERHADRQYRDARRRGPLAQPLHRVQRGCRGPRAEQQRARGRHAARGPHRRQYAARRQARVGDPQPGDGRQRVDAGRRDGSRRAGRARDRRESERHRRERRQLHQRESRVARRRCRRIRRAGCDPTVPHRARPHRDRRRGARCARRRPARSRVAHAAGQCRAARAPRDGRRAARYRERRTAGQSSVVESRRRRDARRRDRRVEARQHARVGDHDARVVGRCRRESCGQGRCGHRRHRDFVGRDCEGAGRRQPDGRPSVDQRQPRQRGQRAGGARAERDGDAAQPCGRPHRKRRHAVVDGQRAQCRHAACGRRDVADGRAHERARRAHQQLRTDQSDGTREQCGRTRSVRAAAHGDAGGG
ncbi:hypothetical protein FEP90_05487 [Burkholderia multivorans]|nr:hypothetical protein [Burkholderia multivorans]MDR8774105.1 hypothetical protein [Burkholderia multivorans]MDR8798346.1 hypothetical protein [Burkholderia multivorans]MDR8804768.1 hypothetical protein [Burkholderia multivorans]MDR8815655.1 hypothetical protein [Burkholderia multivorans]